jgi:hypothetical protein
MAWLIIANIIDCCCGSVHCSAAGLIPFFSEGSKGSGLTSGADSVAGSFDSLTPGGVGSITAGGTATLWVITVEVDIVAPPVPALPFPPVLLGVLGAEDC